MNREIDIRHILPAIRAPTLILHRAGDRVTDIDCARRMAQGIAGAQLIELPGIDHLYTVDGDTILDHVEQFLTGKCHSQDRERVLGVLMMALEPFPEVRDAVIAATHAAENGRARLE